MTSKRSAVLFNSKLEMLSFENSGLGNYCQISGNEHRLRIGWSKRSQSFHFLEKSFVDVRQAQLRIDLQSWFQVLLGDPSGRVFVEPLS